MSSLLRLLLGALLVVSCTRSPVASSSHPQSLTRPEAAPAPDPAVTYTYRGAGTTR
jgi:hypothetical protein